MTDSEPTAQPDDAAPSTSAPDSTPEPDPQGSAAGETMRVLLQWRVRPWRTVEMRRAILSVVLILLALAGVTLLMWGLEFGGAVAAAFWVAMLFYFEDLFWPTTCRITTEGVDSRVFLRFRRVRWADVKRCSFDAHGVRVSSRRVRGSFDPWRSVYLPVDEAQGITRDRLIALVKERRPAHAGPTADIRPDDDASADA